MDPILTGKKYDKIARWWHDQHHDGMYGMSAFQRAIEYHQSIENALDVGCGAGGRFIDALADEGCSVHGIDVSSEMIRLARQYHPKETFEIADICEYMITERYDLIYAWDSIFHIPLSQHQSVIEKMCEALQPNGIILYTFGDAIGEHTDEWMNDTFYYSSIGINENLNILMNAGIKILHLELDQHPQNHVVVIGQKMNAERS